MTAGIFTALRQEILHGRVLLPGDDDYEDSLHRWSATCIKPAAAVVQPRTAEEVSATVKFAKSHGIAFNVKGGGHSTSQTSCAPTPEGMVLDLDLMRYVSVDTAAQTVSFGGGCNWGDVDDALWPHGLATVGGTVSHTGVGGLILHGGFGFLTGQYGLCIDVLQSCQVVLADGRIVNASETENQDLFWALRGAGSGFGVVTRFTSKVFPQGHIWGGKIVYSADKLPQVVDFLNKWAETNDGRQSMWLTLAHESTGKGRISPILAVQMAHVGRDPEQEGPAFFADLLNMDSTMREVGTMQYPAINKTMDDRQAFGRRYLFGGSNWTTPLKPSTIETIHKTMAEFVSSHPDGRLPGSICIFECFPTEKIRQKPDDSMAFNGRGKHFNVGIVWVWEDPDKDGTVREFNRKLQKEIRELSFDERSIDDARPYLNYVNTDELTAKNHQRLDVKP